MKFYHCQSAQNKDGYKVCSELKADDQYSDIPILLLTAVADHVSSTRYSHYDGMSTEADDYLPKPASAEDILPGKALDIGYSSKPQI